MVDLKILKQSLGDLNEEAVLKILKEFMASGPSGKDAEQVVNACQEGMAVVGELFEKGQYFVGDLLFAGDLLSNAISLIKPALGGINMKKIGSIVLGTVRGDVHDIGKNIFKGIAEAAGFEVIDLGIDTPAITFVEKVKTVKPAIVGMSGVLTLALEAMKNTVDELEKAGLRKNVKIIIGGNPVSEESRKMVGADAFTNNAAEGVKICKGWV